MAKKEEKMADTKNDAVVVIYEKDLKPKQTVLDLSTMGEVEIQLFYKEYSPNPAAPIAARLEAARKLVQPADNQAIALCKLANAQNYQAAKAAAMAKGDYMSAQLRSALTSIMAGIQAFAENGAKENFAYWSEAFKDKSNVDRQAKAKKLLDRAKLLVDNEDAAF